MKKRRPPKRHSRARRPGNRAREKTPRESALPRKRDSRARSSGRHVSKAILAKRPKVRADIQARAIAERQVDLVGGTARLNKARLKWSIDLYGKRTKLAESKQVRVSTVLRARMDNMVSDRYTVHRSKADLKTGNLVPQTWRDKRTGRIVGKRTLGQAVRRARERLEDELLGQVYKLNSRDLAKLRKTPNTRRAMMIEIYKGPGGS